MKAPLHALRRCPNRPVAVVGRQKLCGLRVRFGAGAVRHGHRVDGEDPTSRRLPDGGIGLVLRCGRLGVRHGELRDGRCGALRCSPNLSPRLDRLAARRRLAQEGIGPSRSRLIHPPSDPHDLDRKEALGPKPPLGRDGTKEQTTYTGGTPLLTEACFPWRRRWCSSGVLTTMLGLHGE